jgi:hypothetical protein
VLSVWGKPEKSDMTHVIAEVSRAAHLYGSPIVYVTRVPTNAPPPDANVRREIQASLPTLMKSCSSYHVILEGSGFLAALKRGVLTGILQPVWKVRVFFVHASASNILNSIGEEDRANVAGLLEQAGRRGLLHCTSPESGPSALAL